MEAVLFSGAPSISFDETESAVVVDPTYPNPVSGTGNTNDVALVTPSARNSSADVVSDPTIHLEDFKSCERTACTDYLRSQSKSWLAGKTRPIHDVSPPLVTGIVAVVIAAWYFEWPIVFGLAYVAGMFSCTLHQLMFCSNGRARRKCR